ncbi:hypothetical protein HDU93_000980 [Gonapodya sp. JEL0774]|nr:hypothetical protein HDU93_000980 [Gonapodya sp. JEL0774]
MIRRIRGSDSALEVTEKHESEYAALSVKDVMEKAIKRGIAKSRRLKSKEGESNGFAGKQLPPTDLEDTVQLSSDTLANNSAQNTSFLSNKRGCKPTDITAKYAQLVDPRSDSVQHSVADSDALEMKRHEARLDELKAVAQNLHHWADAHLTKNGGLQNEYAPVATTPTPASQLSTTDTTDFDMLIDGVKPWFVRTVNKRGIVRLAEDFRPPAELVTWIGKHASELGVGRVVGF